MANVKLLKISYIINIKFDKGENAIIIAIGPNANNPFSQDINEEIAIGKLKIPLIT